MTRPSPVLLARSGVFLKVWLEVLSAFRRPHALALLLPFVIVQGLFVAALWAFPRAPFGALLKPLFLAAGGEAALHYPDAYAVLPRVFLWANAGLFFLVGSACVAAAAAALPRVFMKRRPCLRSAVTTTLRRLPRIWGASLPFLVMVGGAMIVADLVTAANVSAAREGTALALGIRTSAIVLHALLAYAVIAVAIGDLSVGQAIARSFHLATRNFWTTLGFVVATSALLVPVAWLERDPATWFHAFGPEVAFAFLVARVVLSVLATYLLVAACTRLYLHWFGDQVVDR
jgi:hypothetical protein